MDSILLNTTVLGPQFVQLFWVVGAILFLLLCYGIYRQVVRGRRLRLELQEIEQVRQNNIEYEFLLKAMKIAHDMHRITRHSNKSLYGRLTKEKIKPRG